jgi:hypothetical protein
VRAAAACLGLKADPLARPKSLKGKGWHDSPALAAAFCQWAAAAGGANAAARKKLRELAARLEPALLVLATASDFSVLMQALAQHVGHAGRMGWRLPQLAPSGTADSAWQWKGHGCAVAPEAAAGGEAACGAAGQEDRQMVLRGMWPYWMDGRQGRTVTNDIELGGMALLTGPNMAGEGVAAGLGCMWGRVGLFGNGANWWVQKI